MKKIIIAVLIFAGSSTVTFAQSSKSNTKAQSLQTSDTKQVGVEMAAKTETDKMAKALDLSLDQKTQIHNVNLQVAKNQAIITQAGSNASPDRMTYLMKHKDSEYKKILTSDQYTKYEKMNNGSNVGSPKGAN